ncbi:MAG: asparagine synthase (glutamine-hydrolyzing) [Myxococcales bacterium]|nr:asparagine synthase (glutamine-hydrolyzing) [Myxococcota bacterium]MDW8282527.1 asparagine synthase (glutamine-hydrolyzing) [Myxococcales bacterium]
MCGIAGRVRYDRSECSEVLQRMAQRLRHRGPDHMAVVDLDGVAALAHTRLAIIDLSPLGNQPMTDESGRYTISYNGEVYNFQQLRRELQAAGYRFRSQSDTEVVLCAYVHLGPRAFERFDGMFALAIWDRKERELVLARDRFGEKPLYYYLGPDGALTFASEVHALLSDETIARAARPSVAGLTHYFALGYTLAPLTLYQGIAKLEPATYLRFRDGRIREKRRYWEYRDCFVPRRAEPVREVAAQLLHLLDRAVQERLVSDVPIGAFLSGGVDSSGVVALARRHLPYELHTFTIGFPERSYDEASDAQRVADHLRTVHHERTLRLRERGRISSAIDRAIAAYDEPFSDTSLIPTVEVSRSAARFVKVVLSGDGADELLAGYPTYQADRLMVHAARIPSRVRAMAAAVLARMPQSGRRRMGIGLKLRRLGRGLAADPRYAHYAWRELHSEQERIALIGSEHAEEVRASHPFFVFQRYYDEVAELDWLSQHLYVDSKTWLPDDILVKVDRATMAASIEARAPYLDVELAAFAASIPAHLKVRGMQGKVILKEALKSLLPRETLRKRKAGFNAPIGAALCQDWVDEFRMFNRYVAMQWGLLRPQQEWA